MSFVSCLNTFEDLYYMTVLSNFAAGFDKYSMKYGKENIEKSTFKDKFFLLTPDILNFGF